MAETSSNQAMNWDLTPYFPAFDGPEMRQFKETLQKDVAALQERASALPPLDTGNVEGWEAVFLAFEETLLRFGHLSCYIGCLSAVDARNEAYLREKAQIVRMGADVAKLEVELFRAIKEAPKDLFIAFAGRPAFDGAQYYLNRLRREARLTMTPEKERLAADLDVDGLNAWGRIYNTVSGKLEFDMAHPDGRRERLPMSQRRSLMEDPDRRVRQAAFDGGNAAWETVEDVAAAALNAISGARLTLNRHRGIGHFLDVALFQSSITRRTLDAMFEAILSELDLPRRVLRLKARVMGTKAVAWYDLGAPLPLPDQERLSWEQGKALVQTSFTQAYPALADFLRVMYEKDWIEWEPRAGKRPGGFCTGSRLIAESRIFMTYNRSMGDVNTLAHEVGHAFHNHVKRELRYYAQYCPMTLAESASTFGEMILTEGILADPSVSDAQKARILDMETGHSVIYLMDIPVRYEFEKALYEERAKGELPVSRLKELMAGTQRRVFGPALEEGGEDPYFWASKLHFYITGVTFYNFPYTFGFLLSRGLFAAFRKEGPDFLPRYEAFLRLAGADTPENIARRTLGQDLESPAFWVGAIRSLEGPLNRLEALLPQVMK
jgi:oligoendopeptidase F